MRATCEGCSHHTICRIYGGMSDFYRSAQFSLKGGKTGSAAWEALFGTLALVCKHFESVEELRQ